MRVLSRALQTRGRPLLLVHGNVSSSLFYQRLMLALPDDVLPIAPDLRGYGETEAKPIDATRGLRDHSDDLIALLDALGLDQVDTMGWSMGGGVVTRLAIDAPGRVRTLTGSFKRTRIRGWCRRVLVTCRRPRTRFRGCLTRSRG